MINSTSLNEAHYPMAKENDAHEALSLLFHRDGVPNIMVMDGANEQI
jgi:hypothetical protein